MVSVIHPNPGCEDVTMAIEIKPTQRGFLRGQFVDRYGADCSIQESSLAEEPCIWLGCEHETIHSVTGQGSGARMHLTREMASELLPLLTRFIETGRLAP